MSNYDTAAAVHFCAEVARAASRVKKMLSVLLYSASVAVHVNNGNVRVPCDVDCNWPVANNGLIRTIRFDVIPDKLVMSMEGEEIYPILKSAPPTVTTRVSSQIPMPYFNWPWTRFVDPFPHRPDVWSFTDIQHAEAFRILQIGFTNTRIKTSTPKCPLET